MLKEQNLLRKQNKAFISEQLAFALDLTNISWTSRSDFNYIFKGFIRKCIHERSVILL